MRVSKAKLQCEVGCSDGHITAGNGMIKLKMQKEYLVKLSILTVTNQALVLRKRLPLMQKVTHSHHNNDDTDSVIHQGFL